MPICDVCNEEKPRSGETYNGKPLCRGCIDYMSGKHLAPSHKAEVDIKTEGRNEDG